MDPVYYVQLLSFQTSNAGIHCFQDDDLPIDALMELVQQIISFHMKVCCCSSWLNVYIYSIDLEKCIFYANLLSSVF